MSKKKITELAAIAKQKKTLYWDLKVQEPSKKECKEHATLVIEARKEWFKAEKQFEDAVPCKVVEELQ